MAGANDGRARRQLLSVFFISLLITPQGFTMPPIKNVAAALTTTPCSVCGTVPPLPAAVATTQAAVATTTPAAVASPTLAATTQAVPATTTPVVPATPGVAAVPATTIPVVPATTTAPSVAPQATPAAQGPGPNFAQTQQGPQSAAVAQPANVVATTKAPVKSDSSELNNWIHQQFPDTPKNLNVPMVAGLAAGGAAVAAGVIAGAVTQAKKPQNQRNFLGQGPAPAHPVHSLPRTSLAVAAKKGDLTLEVASTVGFAAGDTIKVGDEYNLVKGFSSLILDHPMNRDHPRGAAVLVVHEPANAQVQTTPPLNQVLGGNFSVPSFKAKGASQGSEKEETQTHNSDMVFFILAGVALCCLCTCTMAAVAVFFRHRGSKRRSGQDEEYSGLSEEEVSESEESDYQPARYRRS